MKQRFLGWLGFVILLAGTPAAAQKRYILRAPASSVSGISSRHGLVTVRPLGSRDPNVFLVTAPEGLPPQFIQQVKSDAAVVDFELDKDAVSPEIPRAQLNQSTVAILDALANRTLVTYFGTSVWAPYVTQPATALIRLADAQSLATGSGTVALIDTGVDPNHPVLKNSLTAGYDFVRELPGAASEWGDLDPLIAAILNQSSGSIPGTPVVVNQSTVAILDQSTVAILDANKLPAAFGHGTMVAGLIHLAAPTAKIMPLKAFKADGTAKVFDVIRAIYFAVENGARVINMSFSLDESSNELMRAINFAAASGVICVSSAGNAGKELLVYPGALRNVLGVASTSNADVRSTFTNFGAALVRVAAPGEGLITTYPGGRYAAAWGTSFSTALVSGGGALLLQINNTVNQDDADDSLSRAQKLGPELGAGRIDLLQALRYQKKL